MGHTSILVIPDTHVAPGEDNTRAILLGKFIKARKPTHIVHIGDLAEMGSMSYHDPVKSCSYQADVKAVHDFMGKLIKHSGKAWDNAKTTFMEGNHEARMRRKVEEMPELSGVISLDHLGVFDWFDDVVEWRGIPGGPQMTEINGVLFGHFMQGRTGRAIGGINHARALLLNGLQSCVVGHSHMLNYATIPKPNGTHVHGLVVGCFFDHDHSWAGQSQLRYWRGVCMLHDVNNGEFDLEQISLHRLQREFG